MTQLLWQYMKKRRKREKKKEDKRKFLFLEKEKIVMATNEE